MRVLQLYTFENEEEITSNLYKIRPTNLKNAYEVKIKDIKTKTLVKSRSGKDVVILDTLVKPLKIKSRLNIIYSKEQFISILINVINENKEYLSTLINDLNENDRIIFFNATVTNAPAIFNKIQFLRINQEKDSLVFIFKYTEDKSTKIKQLSKKKPLQIIFDNNIMELSLMRQPEVMTNKKPNNDAEINMLENNNLHLLPFQDYVKNSDFSVTEQISSEENEQTNPNSPQLSSYECKSPIISFSSSNDSLLGIKMPPYFKFLNDTSSIESIDRMSDSEPLPNMNHISHEPQFLQNLDGCTSIPNCKLVYIEPCIHNDNSEIILGYCVTCTSFISNSSIITLEEHANEYYKCPNCNDNVSVSYFFKMLFIYGQYQNQTKQVYCYGNHAQELISKLVWKIITVEDYITDLDNKKFIINAFQELLRNQTAVTIHIQETDPGDTAFLLSLDV